MPPPASVFLLSNSPPESVYDFKDYLVLKNPL